MNDLLVPNTDLCRSHRVTVTGDRGPVVVLQHGFGTDLDVWEKILPSLLPSFRIVRMDLAGAGPHGSDTFDPDRYDSIEAFADDLLLVLGELGVEKCFYVGSSVGSMIGALASIERPVLFEKLICIAASPCYLNDKDSIGGFEQEHLDQLYDAMSRDYQAWISGFAPMIVRGLPESSAVKHFSDGLFRMRPDIALSMARVIFQSDFRNRLKLIRTPTVLLQTQNDVAVPPQVSEYLLAHIEGSRLQSIPVQGHFPHLVAPDLVSNILLSHLQ